MHRSHLRSEGLSSPPLERSIYINYLEFLRTGALPLLRHLLSYLIIYLYHYGLMNINFLLWVVIQYYFILLLKLFQLWSLGSPSMGPSLPLTYPLFGGEGYINL